MADEPAAPAAANAATARNARRTPRIIVAMSRRPGRRRRLAAARAPSRRGRGATARSTHGQRRREPPARRAAARRSASSSGAGPAEHASPTRTAATPSGQHRDVGPASSARRMARGRRPTGTGRRGGPRARRRPPRESMTNPASSTSRRFCLRPEVAEVHVDAEPVRLDVARLVVGAHRREEHAAGPEPARGSARAVRRARPAGRGSASRTPRRRRSSPARSRAPSCRPG